MNTSKSMFSVVKELKSEVLAAQKYVYLHCIDFDMAATCPVTNLTSLEFDVVIAHISLMDALQERRCVLCLHSENIDLVADMESPIVIEATASCYFKIGDDEIETVADFEIQETYSIGCRAVAPKKIYDGDDPLPCLPWLDAEKVNYCNCARFPNIGIIGIKPNPGINNTTSQPYVPAAMDNMEANDEENLQAQRFKLKGTCYHADFQVTLKRMKKEFMVHDLPIQTRIRTEPDNSRDCNAVVAEVMVQGHWKIIGYIPAVKLQKVHSAIIKHQITEIRLISIDYTYYEGHGRSYYIPTIAIVKHDRWLKNNPDYKYNDPLGL